MSESAPVNGQKGHGRTENTTFLVICKAGFEERENK
jgi:hypothetical protein